LLALLSVAAFSQDQPSETFNIYVIDAEEGRAILYVSPSGETVLEDTGIRSSADRIVDVMHAAGVKQIDHLLLTNYGGDHITGLSELAKQIPIKHFMDHGPALESPDREAPGFTELYPQLYSHASHTVVKLGDKIPIAGLDVTVITAGGQTIKAPLPGGGKPNPDCTGFKPQKSEAGLNENSQTVGVVYTFGKFRSIDLGDLNWNKEAELMCPNNPIGEVDLYITSYHGVNRAGSPALVHGLQPTVAIMPNSAIKGGTAQTMRTLYSSPGLQDVWQLHWAFAGGLESNSPGLFIANLQAPASVAAFLMDPASAGPLFGDSTPSPRSQALKAPAPPPGVTPTAPIQPWTNPAVPSRSAVDRQHLGKAFWLKVSAQSDGTFTVTNTRNSFSKTYAARN